MQIYELKSNFWQEWNYLVYLAKNVVVLLNPNIQ